MRTAQVCGPFFLEQMIGNVRLYTAVFLLLGVSVAAYSFANWQIPDHARFLSFFGLALSASIGKVALPGFAGRMPFNFLFVLVALVELSAAEALLLACASSAVEMVWDRTRRARLGEIYFNLATVAVAVAAAQRVLTILRPQPGFPEWLAVAMSGTAFFIFSTFPRAAIVALTERSPVLSIWIRRHIDAFPVYLAGSCVAFVFHEVASSAGWAVALLTIPAVYLLFRTYELYMARIGDQKRHADQMANLHMRTIEALALAIEAKDDTTSNHLRRVRVYAVEVGREIGMPEEELEALQAAAVLHDIGKLAVPEYIISKPGKLTPEEFDKMKVHPVVGAEILEHVQFPYPVVPIVRAHHEKWNGTGYPYGLRGKDIPLGARILSAVDALDALATDRQYRRALPLDEAMSKIEEESGRSFDPDVVAVLRRRYRELEQMAQSAKGVNLKLSTGVRITRGAAPATGFESSERLKFSSEPGTIKDLHEAITQARSDVQSVLASNSTLNLHELCALLGVRIKRVINYDAIVVYLVRDDELVPVHVHGDNHRLFSSLRIPLGQGLSGWVAENRKPILNGNPSVESGYLNNANISSTLRSALAVPLESAAGNVIGVLSLYHDSRDAFTRDELRILQSITPKLAAAIENAAGRSTQITAPFAPDGVGLLRRLDTELARSRRLNLPLGVVVCSINGYHDMTPGEAEHAFSSVARLARGEGREFEIMARTAENEIVLVITGMPRHSLHARAARLHKVTLSSGATVITGAASYPDDGTDGEQLLAAADRNVLREKLQPVPLPVAAFAHRNWA